MLNAYWSRGQKAANDWSFLGQCGLGYNFNDWFSFCIPAMDEIKRLYPRLPVITSFLGFFLGSILRRKRPFGSWGRQCVQAGLVGVE